MYMGIQFVQNVDLRNKNCNQFLVKKRVGKVQKE